MVVESQIGKIVSIRRGVEIRSHCESIWFFGISILRHQVEKEEHMQGEHPHIVKT